MENDVLQIVPLSPVQKRIWTGLDDPFVYHHMCLVEVKSSLDLEKMKACITRALSNHEIFLTRFENRKGLALPVPVVQDNIEKTKISYRKIDDLEEILNPAASAGMADHENTVLSVELFTLNPEQFYMRVKLPLRVADTYSVQYLATEIGMLYCDAVYRPETAEKIEYSQYAEWQKELRISPDEETSEFWQQYDFESGNQSPLAFAYGDDHHDEFNVGQQAIKLNKTQQTALNSHTHPQYMLFATYALMLQRLLNDKEVTIGFDLGKRAYNELDHTLGPISRALPLVFERVEHLTFENFANAVISDTEQISDKGDYFDWDEESTYPYFRWFFQYIATPEAVGGNQTFEILNVDSTTERFDLNLQVQFRKGQYQLQFKFDGDKFKKQDIEELNEQFLDLLEVVLKSPSETIKKLYAASTAIPTANEVKPKKDSPDQKTILDLFKNAVGQNKSKIAVQGNGTSYTYQELDLLSDQVAGLLANEQKIRSGQIVAVNMNRSTKLAVLLLGVLKSGAAYLPIDPKTPIGRIDRILEDSGAVVYLTDADHTVNREKTTQVRINDNFWQNAKNYKKAPKVLTTADQATYVIYTSGSTGKPKGVVISHRALVNYAEWFINKYQITNADRTMLFSSIAFDLCYTSLWSSLLSGASLVMHEENQYLDPIAFTKDLIDSEITYIKLTPSHFKLIAKDPDFEEKCKKYQLRLIVLGGEEMVVDDVSKYLEYVPDAQFVNHYGPTESTIGVLTYDIDLSNIKEYCRRPVIGFPIDHMDVCLLDENRQPVVKGQLGELYISGRGLAEGYLNDNTQTSEKFVNLPGTSGHRLYQSGDLGIMMPDGSIQFKGRKDFQVKIRGFRIELGEIEKIILANNTIKEVSVQVQTSKDTGESQLIAFVVGSEGFDQNQLKKYIEKQLPHYMVPARMIDVSFMPLLPNGKVDAKALLSQAEEASTSGYQPAATATEEMLVAIWQEVLVREKVGVLDNFFELGGHSLKAAQLVTRIFKKCQKKIELKAVFDSPTIAQQAKILDQSEHEAYQSITQVEHREYYELSHAQKRLWILDHFQKEKIPYTSPFYFKLKGKVDKETLAQALDSLIQRHESLRTTFELVEGEPMQKIHEVADCGFELVLEDVSKNENSHQYALDRAASESEHQFDLEKGPLFLARLFEISKSEWLLAFNIHHIISDGWSLRILFEELLTIYDDLQNKRNSSLKPLKVQYKDYAAWHNQAISGKEEQYWMNKLANHPDLINLPYDEVENPDAQPYVRNYVTFSEEESAQIKSIAKSLQTTTSNFMLSIYAVFINQIAGHDDFLIGVGHANRNHEDTEGLIGFFINMLAIRIQISDDDTLSTIVSKSSQSAVEALENSNYPFDLIIEKICKKRQADRQPILNVMYDFKNFYDVSMENESKQTVADMEIEMIKTGAYIAAHDLILHVVEDDTHITYDFEYKKECFLPETAQNFYNVFSHLARLVITELAEPADKILE